MFTAILLEKKERIATITLNRPETSNSFSAESYSEIIEACSICDSDDEVGAVIITGAGKNFSAGGDINRFKRLIDSGEFLDERNIQKTGRMITAIRRCGKPVIAMVNGAAAGAGCSVALGCDFRIMSPSSKLVCSFVKVALPGDSNALHSLQLMVGTAKAMELLMTGDVLRAEEALRLGLATKVVPQEDLLQETKQFALQFANGPGMVYRCQKRLLYESFYSETEVFTDHESAYMQACSRTYDFKEAVEAFLEKRPTAFKGK